MLTEADLLPYYTVFPEPQTGTCEIPNCNHPVKNAYDCQLVCGHTCHRACIDRYMQFSPGPKFVNCPVRDCTQRFCCDLKGLTNRWLETGTPDGNELALQIDSAIRFTIAQFQMKYAQNQLFHIQEEEQKLKTKKSLYQKMTNTYTQKQTAAPKKPRVRTAKNLVPPQRHSPPGGPVPRPPAGKRPLKAPVVLVTPAEPLSRISTPQILMDPIYDEIERDLNWPNDCS